MVFFFSSVKMNQQGIKFGDVNVDKKEFYSSKHILFLNDVDLDKIVVSGKWKINDTTCKYYVGYNSSELIRPLCVIMPQMTGYVKYFDDGGKNMSFASDDEEVYLRYNAIWDTVKKLLKLKFSTNPVRDDKYICCKLKIFSGVNKSTFTDVSKVNQANKMNENVMPMERNCYLCIAAIDVDSVLKVDKKVYPQVYLEFIKKRIPVDFVDIDIIDDSDDSD